MWRSSILVFAACCGLGQLGAVETDLGHKAAANAETSGNAEAEGDRDAREAGVSALTATTITASGPASIAGGSADAVAGGQGAGGQGAGGYRDLLACREIEDPAARVTCYDIAVDKFAGAVAAGDVNVVEKTSIRKLQRDSFGLAIPGAKALVSLFNRDSRDISTADDAVDHAKKAGQSGNELGPYGPDQDAARNDGAVVDYDKKGDIKSIRNIPVRDVTYTRLGYMRVTLENGQVWQQSETKSLRRVSKRLKNGLTAEIRRGALGSYFIKLSHDSRAVRAKRLQ